MTAMATAALVAVAPDQASAAGPCTRTYSNVANEPIKDFTVVDSVIDVPEDGLEVVKVTVAANLHHPSDSDLAIVLQSESDRSDIRAGSLLYDHFDGLGGNFLGTVWDDSAERPISLSQAPHTGTWRPPTALAALSVLAGFSGGRYRLFVSDDRPGTTGTLDDWAVTLTYATCDVDNDGLDVPADLCPNVPATTSSGCPLATRRVTAKYRSGKLRGEVASSAAGCKAGHAVSVFRKRPGPDRRIGRATTLPDGSFRLARPKRKGRYYATSPRVVVPGAAECPAVRSGTFRVR